MLLTVKESAINVPQNLEARRRITFFANSLFMTMPSAPKVRKMLPFRLVTEKTNSLCENSLDLEIVRMKIIILQISCHQFGKDKSMPRTSFKGICD